jgi:hypothetical protein
MATKKGWKINYDTNIAVTVASDVSEGEVMKWTSEGVAETCGAGEMPAGVAIEDRDVSEGETSTSLARGPSIAVVAAAAAVTDLMIPLKVAASGTCTPCTADQDIILGMPLALQATVGGDVPVDLTLMGTYYATT